MNTESLKADLTSDVPLSAAEDAWQSIDTAPKDGSLVKLRNAEYYRPDLLWEWSKRRRQWETVLFAPARKVRASWSGKCGNPTHWLPVLMRRAIKEQS